MRSHTLSLTSRSYRRASCRSQRRGLKWPSLSSLRRGGSEESESEDDPNEGPSLRGVVLEEFLPGYQDMMRRTMTPLWLPDRRGLEKWLEINNSPRGHGGMIRLPMLLSMARGLSSSDQVKKKELLQGARFAYETLAQSYGDGDLSPLKGNSTPLLRSAVDSFEAHVHDNNLKWEYKLNAVSDVEIVGIASLFFLPDYTDRLVSDMSKNYVDDTLVQQAEEGRKRGKLMEVFDNIWAAHYSCVYWAKISSDETMRILDKNGTVIAETPKGIATHIWKFQLDLPPAEERLDPEYAGGEWKLVDMNNFAISRLRSEMLRSQTRLRPSEAFPINAIWGAVVDNR